jgi:toxin ParE1/3/4
MAEIAAYRTGEASEEVARRIIGGILARLDLRLDFPESGAPRGRVRPDLRVVFKHHYGAYYLVTPAEILVIRVLHGARDLDSISDRWTVLRCCGGADAGEVDVVVQFRDRDFGADFGHVQDVVGRQGGRVPGLVGLFENDVATDGGDGVVLAHLVDAVGAARGGILDLDSHDDARHHTGGRAAAQAADRLWQMRAWLMVPPTMATGSKPSNS